MRSSDLSFPLLPSQYMSLKYIPVNQSFKDSTFVESYILAFLSFFLSHFHSSLPCAVCSSLPFTNELSRLTLSLSSFITSAGIDFGSLYYRICLQFSMIFQLQSVPTQSLQLASPWISWLGRHHNLRDHNHVCTSLWCRSLDLKSSMDAVIDGNIDGITDRQSSQKSGLYLR